MTNMKKMMKMVGNAFTAASFAEEGELDTAKTLMSESRRVLLALKAGHIDSKTLKYALNTAVRIGASLDILHVAAAGNNSDRSLEPFLSEVEAAGVPYRLIRRTGCLRQQIIDYSTSEKEILFAVIESHPSLDTDCKKGSRELSELWRSLKCPLVVVMEGARA